MGKTFVYNTGSSDDDKKDDEIREEFGVFIDGTLNNKDNTDLRNKYANTKDEKGLSTAEKEERKQYLKASHRGPIDKLGTDNSFSNDYTNVARKWKCCNEKYAIYVPGMGTSDVETQGIGKDDDDGFQYGAGSKSGIRARVRLGCERLAVKIAEKVNDKKNKGKKATEITVDVFGFSRGAAAARNFVYEITKDEYAPGDIEISYYENQKVLRPSGNINSDKLHEYTERVKKKKKVKQADADGLKTESKFYTDGLLPRMGHLGYSLLKLKITPQQLKQIEIKVRFLGIYDTVSSYEEWGPMGGDSTIKKGIQHLTKSLFKNDIEQLNLNTLSCTKIVHFTTKDEHRENFDLTRIPNANIKSKTGTYKRIEKNFPGVHCDIGGAYLTGSETIDEIEVANKPDLTGFRKTYYKKGAPANSLPVTPMSELRDYRQKLITEYWYKDYELKIEEELSGRLMYHKLVGKRAKIYKEYSYIPLHFMKDYCTVYMKEFFIESTFTKYAINDANLKAAYAHLKPYVMNEGGKEWAFVPDAVFIRKQNIEKAIADKKEKERQEKLKKSIIIDKKPTSKKDNVTVNNHKLASNSILKLTEDQILLRKLRHDYFHWSANRDWAGMDPNFDKKRREH